MLIMTFPGASGIGDFCFCESAVVFDDGRVDALYDMHGGRVWRYRRCEYGFSVIQERIFRILVRNVWHACFGRMSDRQPLGSISQNSLVCSRIVFCMRRDGSR